MVPEAELSLHLGRALSEPARKNGKWGSHHLEAITLELGFGGPLLGLKKLHSTVSPRESPSGPVTELPRSSPRRGSERGDDRYKSHRDSGPVHDEATPAASKLML